MFDFDLESFIRCCEDYGVSVNKGTGRVMMNGKDIDVAKALKDSFLEPISSAVLDEFASAHKSPYQIIGSESMQSRYPVFNNRSLFVA